MIKWSRKFLLEERLLAQSEAEKAILLNSNSLSIKGVRLPMLKRWLLTQTTAEVTSSSASQDSPRKIVGLKNDNFENLKQEVFTDAINALFSPAIEWEMGTIVLEEEKEDGNGVVVTERKKDRLDLCCRV
jgi:hypothetical protein